MKIAHPRTDGTLWLSAAAVAVIAGCGQNRFEKEVQTETSAVNLAREARRGEYSLITTSELKKLIDDKADLTLIDAMPLENFEKEHIPGAKQFLLPIPEMAEWDAQKTGGTREQFLEALGPDKARLLVFYCGFVKCTRSHNGAMWAVKEGYTNVRRHPGGIYAWKGAGHPTESGG